MLKAPIAWWIRSAGMSSRALSSSSSVRMASLVPDEKPTPTEGGQERKGKKSYGTANMDSEGRWVIH